MDTDARAAHQKLFQLEGLPNPVAPIGLKGLSGRTADDQYEADAAYWYGTLAHEESQWTTLFLRRVWSILWHGGLWMKDRNGIWKTWHDANIPIAACLSHGGRVVVQLDRTSYHPNEPWEWLWGDNHTAEKRGAATHGFEFGDFGKMPDGRPKRVREVKTFLGMGGVGSHFGVNFCGGGLGYLNPISGNRIVADGRHGHLYICYVAPTPETDGAIMFGAEDTAPFDRARVELNQVIAIGAAVPLLPLTMVDALTGGGIVHQPWAPIYKGIFPKGQTGAYHALGVSGKYSITGGEKFKELTKLQPDLAVPVGNDAMFVHPDYGIWQQLFNGARRFEEWWLGHAPPPPQVPTVPVMPTEKEFAKATFVSLLHVRNNWLKEMDKCVDAYAKASGRNRLLSLTQFLSYGRKYLSDRKGDPDKVKAQVEHFMHIAEALINSIN